MRTLCKTLPVLVAGMVAASPADAQEAGEERGELREAWNSDRALELVRRGRARRHRIVADSALLGYRATARGHVFFLVDRTDEEERTLVKADQLALEVSWKAPNLVRQRIVGRRDERKLPTNIRYHLDHLTVVTDDFDDRITLGEGDEVRSVLHPLAPGSEATYDVRLSDSLTVRLPGQGDDVRVYELEVRPRSGEEPGFLGSLFLDRSTGGVVRMRFTFNPASYVDPYLDYIRISLDNARWLGGHWLPHRQEVEIRRELPYLDVSAGSIIQARWEIGDYEFNPGLDPEFFAGPEVTRLSDDALASHDFQEGLYEPLERDGLVAPPGVEEIRRRAARVAGERYLGGLGPLRFLLPSASSAVRYNRAEGVFVGSGFSYRPDTRLGIELQGGYSFGRRKPVLATRVDGGEARPGTGTRLFLNDLRDLGPLAGTSGLGNSLAVAALEADYLDPYFASGVAVSHRLTPRDGPGLEIEARWERHDAARMVLEPSEGAPGFRPVRAIDEGVVRSVGIEASLGSPGPRAPGLSSHLRLTGGTFEEDAYGGVRGRIRWARSWLGEDVDLLAELHAGAVTADAPVQALFHLGGRGTLPGYRYREFAGDSFVLFRTSAAWGVAAPWIRPRIFGSVGSTTFRNRVPPTGRETRATPIPQFSAGVGAGLLWDVVRVSAARGLTGGEWEWVVSINKRFWPHL